MSKDDRIFFLPMRVQLARAVIKGGRAAAAAAVHPSGACRLTAEPVEAGTQLEQGRHRVAAELHGGGVLTPAGKANRSSAQKQRLLADPIRRAEVHSAS